MSIDYTKLLPANVRRALNAYINKEINATNIKKEIALGTSTYTVHNLDRAEYESTLAQHIMVKAILAIEAEPITDQPDTTPVSSDD